MPTKQPRSVKIDAATYERIKKFADETGRTIQGTIKVAIQYLILGTKT